MKQCAIICLSPYSGGMEIDTLKLANLLADSVKITLLVKKNTFLEKTYSQFQHPNITLKSINFSSNLSFSLIFQARAIIKNNAIKNVIFFGASELKSLYFSFLGLDINLLIRHGTTKSTPKKDFFHKLIYSNVTYHIGICKHIANNVKHIIPFGKKTQLKLIYSSLKFPDNEYKTTSKIKILHVGRIATGKGQEDAIKACEILYKNNIAFEFSIVGGCDNEAYFKEFKTLLNTLEYQKHIHLLGHQTNLTEIFQEHSIFLFPSHGEGLSNSFLEALFFKQVCLSYDNTSFPELQNLGFNFHMAKHKSIEDLKTKLLYICQNFQYEQKNALENHDKTKQLFSKEREKQEYLKLLK